MREINKVFIFITTKPNLITLNSTTLAIRGGSAYELFRQKYAKELAAYRRKIDKTVDLFSRIKSTEQAEEITTVLYSARKLKEEGDAQAVSEQDIYQYIIDWKKSWDKEDKRKAIANAIRNLEMLNWVRLQYSEELISDPF